MSGAADWNSVMGERVEDAGEGVQERGQTMDVTPTSSGSDPSPVMVEMAEAKEAARKALGIVMTGGGDRSEMGAASGPRGMDGRQQEEAGAATPRRQGQRGMVSDGESPKEECLICEKTITKAQIKYVIRCLCGQIVVHANPNGKNCHTGVRGAAACVAMAFGYLKPDGTADLNHPEVRRLLKQYMGFCLRDPTLVVGYVSWDGVKCPRCMQISSTPMVRNLFGSAKDSSSSESESDGEQDGAEEEGVGASGEEEARHVIDLTSDGSREASPAPPAMARGVDAAPTATEQWWGDMPSDRLLANVERAADVMLVAANNQGHMGELEAEAWGAMLAMGSRGVKMAARALGWREGEALPRTATPEMWESLSEALRSMGRDLRSMAGQARDQGVLLASGQGGQITGAAVETRNKKNPDRGARH